MSIIKNKQLTQYKLLQVGFLGITITLVFYFLFQMGLARSKAGILFLVLCQPAQIVSTGIYMKANGKFNVNVGNMAFEMSKDCF